MTRLFGDNHRRLQDRLQTRELADRIEEVALTTEFNDMTRAFVESRDMFFLSTIDQNGRPTCSYKGGAPGFVRVLDDKTLLFPSYNGNGMQLSAGNIVGQPSVGLLFIDFETPSRLRVQGEASLIDHGPLLDSYPEAELVMQVAVTEIWPNCPRYVHRYVKQDDSRYLPRETCETPIAEWKRIDGLQDVITPAERDRVAASGGTITQEEWFENIARGEG